VNQTLGIERSSSSAALSSATTPKTTTALIRLLTVALKSTNISERIAAAYAFGCYLYHNLEGQLYLASTLNPPPSSIGVSSSYFFTKRKNT